MSVLSLGRLFWGWVGLPHLLLVVLPLAALSIQMRYRIPNQYLSWVLPWIGVALSALSLLFFLDRVLAHSDGERLRTTLDRFERWSLGASLALFGLSVLGPAWLGSRFFPILLWSGVAVASAALVVHASRVMARTLSGSLQSSFHWLERATLLLIVAFVGYGAVALVNGALDFSAPTEKKSQVVTIERAEVNLGRFVSVSWADLRSWQAEGLERIFLHEHERPRMWPGQAVLVRIHRGALGIPWVSRVNRDDEIHYRKILESAPTATGPRKHLITFYLERQRWEEATAVALEYLKLYPDDYDYISGVATQLGLARRTKESLALLETFVAGRPSYEVLNLVGWGLHQTGQSARGIALLESAIALEPESWWAYYHLGYAYRAVGRLPDAVAMFEKVLERRPGYPEVQQQLHQLRQRLGNRPGWTRSDGGSAA